MNDFEKQITETAGNGLLSMEIGILQVNLGLRCNQQCNHCHLEASPHLRESFNQQTVAGLMCRHQISVGWDGTLYDCDFNLALGLPVNHGAPDHIQSFRPADLRKRRIVTGEHCFACTAGSGSSCGGALV